MPALAVADELRARGARVTFVTTPSQAERVGSRYPARTIAMRGFERRLLARENLSALALLAAAAPRAWRVIGAARPAVVVGGGGFASGPVVALAAVRGVPGVVLEADAHLGVANRLLRPFVRRVCLSFPIAGLTGPKYVVTGRPLSPAQTQATREQGLAAFRLRADLPTVLVFGGSQGAQSLNAAALEAFARPDIEFQVVHVCGPRNLGAAQAELARRAAPVERYLRVPYTDQLALAMAAADLVVARSGGSVAEIAALGRPAILVPYPHATADHQRKNAQWMAAAGAAVMVADAELTGSRLGVMVRELLGDRERLQRMAAASAALGRRDASGRVVDEIERVLNERAR
jgi:UDP-N-acetylglucosamine--N-acetylmuramyl-(pentapeptide) pyrophosphoryl-undecaprenol N-acetylglucosamine transferase